MRVAKPETDRTVIKRNRLRYHLNRGHPHYLKLSARALALRHLADSRRKQTATKLYIIRYDSTLKGLSYKGYALMRLYRQISTMHELDRLANRMMLKTMV